MMLHSFIFICFVQYAMGYLVNYYFHENNGNDANECANNAMSTIMKETCLVFQHNPHAHNAIFFLQSRRCGFQESNATVHLGSNCVTSESCTQFVHHAITGEKKHHSTAIRNLNLKYNCTDKCTIQCQNGGKVITSDCSCKCDYGFTGKYCEHLKFNEQFTDSSCGIIEADSYGVISLKGQADRDTFCQWVLKSEDAFQTFEIEIEQLDLNDENIPPGQRCGDSLYIYGAKGFENPIPCDTDSLTEDGESSLIGTKIYSSSPLLFIEYRGNRLSSGSHKGPVFKYTTINAVPFSNEFPSLKYEHVTAGARRSATICINFVALISTILLFIFSIVCF